MSGRVREYLTPGWLAFHLMTAALVVTMVLLGRWQLVVSNHKHFNIQNFAYALQWWVFSATALGMWARIVRDRRAPQRQTGQVSEAAEQPHTDVAYRRYVMPRSADAAPAEDPEIAAYNDYLANLAKGERQDG